MMKIARRCSDPSVPPGTDQPARLIEEFELRSGHLNPELSVVGATNTCYRSEEGIILRLNFSPRKIVRSMSSRGQITTVQTDAGVPERLERGRMGRENGQRASSARQIGGRQGTNFRTNQSPHGDRAQNLLLLHPKHWITSLH